MTPLLFAVLLIAAIALLALALSIDNAAFGVVSALLFLIVGGVLFSDGLSELPGFANSGLALMFVIFSIGIILKFAVGDS